MRGATRSILLVETHSAISIHAPHARSDALAEKQATRATPISIHAPHARSDGYREYFESIGYKFQSTLLMRGATATDMRRYTANDNFNPRSSCEERQDAVRMVFDAYKFQSTLLMRGATVRTARTTRREVFQSTLLMRGATKVVLPGYAGDYISIHAPHARSDQACVRHRRVLQISIHAPHARSDSL